MNFVFRQIGFPSEESPSRIISNILSCGNGELFVEGLNVIAVFYVRFEYIGSSIQVIYILSGELGILEIAWDGQVG